ncbi:M20 family metallopeptidase [Microbacteriaceae bacterium 4G12]
MGIESIIDFQSRVKEMKDEVIRWRRYLHKYPELSFYEEKTAAFVYETLQSFGGLEVTRPTKTSVMARLQGAKQGKVIALRADMDALPIEEENTFEFASCHPGVMHACGHDGHTAMLLGAAKILTKLKNEIHGEIRFLFQHAEEMLPGGAEEMINAGVMDGVDAVFGIHLWSTIEVGKVGIVYGPMMAALDTFSFTIYGKGGHAALPHETIDSIAIATQVVTNLQHIVSRNTDPLDSLVISITKFVGGTTHNVIPGSVEIVGTVRSLNPAVRETIPSMMERVIKGITEAHGATYQLEYQSGYRPVINEEETTKVVEETAKELFGEEQVLRMKPIMGSEDFSAYQQQAPGTFFYVGAGNKEKGIVYPHHHPKFTIDEDALENGIMMFLQTVMKLVNK